MMTKLKIDVFSDAACPWCAIEVAGHDRSLAGLAGDIDAELAFRPFEHNFDTPPSGENGPEHVARRYGLSYDQVCTNHAALAKRAASVDFVKTTHDDSRIVDTFDVHRPIAWASDRGRGADTEGRLLAACFTEQGDVSDRMSMVAAAAATDLNEAAARGVGAGRLCSAPLGRSRMANCAINGVPAVRIDDRHHISAGQPLEEFKRQLGAIVAIKSGHDHG